MNSVATKRTAAARYMATNLIGRNMCKHGHTAFVGQCGLGPAHSLYLITYNAVVLASEPDNTWDSAATVVVDHFCGVSITEV